MDYLGKQSKKLSDQKKVGKTTMITKKYESLNEDVKGFQEFDSKIFKSSNENGYSQDGIEFLKKLHQGTKQIKRKYESMPPINLNLALIKQNYVVKKVSRCLDE